ncbi:MAG: hypothetical protein ACRDG4_08190 [Chloroflexota bacterium]
MAGGIFILAAMQRIPDAVGLPTEAAVLILIAIWTGLAWLFAQAVRAGQLPGSRPAAVFAMGTWVAATAVVAATIMLAFPGLRVLAVCFAALAACLWLWFLWSATRDLGELLIEHGHVSVTGTILLTTVGTQSLVLAGQRSLPNGAPHFLCLLLLLVGLAYYAAGATLIGVGIAARRTWTLVQDWRAPRCILHGAISITGLAALRGGVFPWPVAVGLWILAATLFVVVESVEVIRLGLRVRAQGWRSAVVIYHPAQWARNFTFGMFYAFTLALSLDSAATRGAPWAAAFWQWLADWAQYAVLGLLAGEAILLLAYLSHARWLAGRRSF